MSRSATDWDRHWFLSVRVARVGPLSGSRADDVAVKAYQVLRPLHSPRAYIHELQRIVRLRDQRLPGVFYRWAGGIHRLIEDGL